MNVSVNNFLWIKKQISTWRKKKKKKKNPTGQPSEMVHKLSIALRIAKRCDTCICFNNSNSSIFHLNITNVNMENCLKAVSIRGDI